MARAIGLIVRGLRIASGKARDPRFPKGTIALQLPHFRAAIPGFDALLDAPLHLGTLNIAFPGRRVRVGRPEHLVRNVRWSRRAGMENFYLSPCVVEVRGIRRRGLIYIPDPATKPRGLPVGVYAEVLTSHVPRLRYGMAVRLFHTPGAVRLERVYRKRR